MSLKNKLAIFDLDGKSLGNIEIIKDELEIDKIVFNRVMDMNARDLRHIKINLSIPNDIHWCTNAVLR